MRLMSCSLLIFFFFTIFTAALYLYMVISLFVKSHILPRKEISLSSLYSENEDELINYNNSSDHHKTQIHLFKSQLMMNLRKAEFDKSSVLFQRNLKNIYKIKFKGIKGSKLPNKKLLCEISFKYFQNGWIQINKFQESNKTTNCAMVTSSGSISGSKLGREIDSHSVVLRFNNAPTQGFEEDVGSKTTVRIINSNLVLNNTFNLTTSPLYENVKIFVWDPSDYDINLNNWRSKRKPFFEAFENLRRSTKNQLNLIHPEIIWKLWDALQSSTFSTLPKTTPSSGFIGLLYLLNICSTVNVYEYIPSLRLTNRCHYYDDWQSRGCTFGDWHPLATEKLFVLALNQGSDHDLVVDGKVDISGC